MRGKLICVMGIDGSGKTTLILNLIRQIRKSGFLVEYKWMKFESLPLKFFIAIKNKIIVREKAFKVNYSKSSKYRRFFHSNPIIKIVYRYYMYLAYFLQIKIEISRMLKNDITIICDRYIFDTLLDYSIMFNDGYERMINRIKFFSKIVPSPDVVFYIRIHPTVAFERKNDIPSLQFLQEKYDRYEVIYSEFHNKSLYGSKQKDDLKKDAYKVLSRILHISSLDEKQ